MKPQQLKMAFNGLNPDFKPIAHRENNKGSQAILDANLPRFSNQCKILFEYLKEGNKITVINAMMYLRIGDPRRRLKDLADKYGIEIESNLLEGRYKEYFLKEHEHLFKENGK